MSRDKQTWLLLRREPLYHKVQYSKVPKYDSSAAILGTVVGAFGGYLALATVGSGGTDLTDLTILVSWVLVFILGVVWNTELRASYSFVLFAPAGVWLRPLGAFFLSLGKELRAAVRGRLEV